MRKAILSSLEICVVPGLIIVFFLFTTHAFFDASDDAVIALLLRGKIGDYSIDSFPRFYFFIAPVLHFLYQKTPSVPWLGVFFVFVHYLIALGVLQFLKYQFPRFSKGVIYAVYLVFILLYFSENFMFFNMNRVSILSSVVGLFLLMLTKSKRLGWCLFILGMLIRPYGGLLAVLLVLPMLFLLQKRKTYTQYFLVIIVMVGGFFALFKLVSDFPEELRIKNKLKSNVLDHGLVKQTSVGQREEILIEAVHQGYYQDDVITNDFLKEFSGTSRWQMTNIRWDKVERFLKQLWWSISRNYQLIILLNFILLIIFKNSRAWIATLYFWFLVFGLGVVLKLPEKLFSPMLCSWSLILIWQLKKNYNRIAPWVKIMVLIFVVGYTVKIIHRTIGAKNIQQHHEAVIGTINKDFEGKTVYMTKFNYILNYLDPLKNYQFKQKPLVSITGWPTLLPDYKKILSSACGAQSFQEMFLCEKKHQRPVIIFNEKDGASFLKDYYKQIHAIDINFVPIKDEDSSKPYWPYQIQHVISTEN